MRYSEFNDIITTIAAMDAGVIIIKTSCSDIKLLDVLGGFTYPNEIDPDVYDIHSPNIPSSGQILTLMHKALARIPNERL